MSRWTNRPGSTGQTKGTSPMTNNVTLLGRIFDASVSAVFVILSLTVAGATAVVGF